MNLMGKRLGPKQPVHGHSEAADCSASPHSCCFEASPLRTRHQQRSVGKRRTAAAAYELAEQVDGRVSLGRLLVQRPEAVLAHPAVPRAAVLFLAGAVAGAIGKTVTAPLDRVKILLQVGLVGCVERSELDRLLVTLSRKPMRAARATWMFTSKGAAWARAVVFLAP